MGAVPAGQVLPRVSIVFCCMANFAEMKVWFCVYSRQCLTDWFMNI